jgi:hypothetical protein
MQDSKTICICIKLRQKIHSLTDGEINIYIYVYIYIYIYMLQLEPEIC